MKKALRPNIGTALLFSADQLDPKHFGSTNLTPSSASKDVIDYTLISKLNGLTIQTFIGDQATRQNFFSALRKAASSLKSGDFLMLTFSGFGGVVTNFGSTKDGPVSSTWCFYNGQLLELELLQVLSEFESGINILVIADASGTWSGLKFQPFQESKSIDQQRALPIEVAETVYLQNKDFYDAIYLGTNANPEINANVIWLSACQTNQIAYETKFNGYLTSAIKHVWNGAMFKGDYELFIREITLCLPAYQSPLVRTYGQQVSTFLAKKPFTV